MMNNTYCPLCQSLRLRFLYERPRNVKETFDGSGRQYWLCADCRLIFLPVAFHLDAASEKKRYDCHHNHPGDQGYVNFLKKLADPLLEKLTTGDEGLDFGCGPGPTLSGMLRQRGFPVADYDPIYFPAPELLRSRYDFVTASEVVEHFRDPRAEFTRLKQLVREDGGFLAVMTKMWRAEEDFSNWYYMREPSHVCFYQKETFQHIARWLNWRVEFPCDDVAIYQTRGTQS